VVNSHAHGIDWASCSRIRGSKLLTIVRNTAYTWLEKNRSPALVVTDDLEGVEGVDIGSATIRLMVGAQRPHRARRPR
jgi:hypothetical protein